jgi:membrane-associated phospholipid phosphatase
MIDATSGRQAVSANTQVAARHARAHTAVVVALFLIAFVAALALDLPISTYVHQSPGFLRFRKLCQDYRSVHYALRFYGHFSFALIAGVALFLRDKKRGVQPPLLGRDSAIVVLAGIFSWINQPLKWCVGRFRPYHMTGMGPFDLHPFYGGPKGLIMAEGPLSFPSGDTTLAFAMAASLSYADPQRQLLWWALGLWIALERVAEAAHYPSDTVAGAALGIGCAFAARKIVQVSIQKRQAKL